MALRRLQEMFGNDKSLFEAYIRNNPDYAIKFGFDTPDDLWAANPEVVFVA